MQDLNLNLPFSSQLPNIFSLADQHVQPLKKKNAPAGDSQSESFEPDNHLLKKLGIKANKKKIVLGSWSAQQNQIYLDFMIKYKSDFLDQKTRRTTKIFYRLSKLLKHRTPDQCRSHHQKLQIRFHDDLDAIMLQVLRKVQRSIAEKFVNTYHQYYNPSYLAVQNLNKEPSGSANKPNKPRDPNHEIQQQKWYKLSMRSNKVKISIKTSFIEEWNQQ